MENLVVRTASESIGELSYQLAEFKDKAQKLCRPPSFDVSEQQIQEQAGQLQGLLQALHDWSNTVINLYGAMSYESETSALIYNVENALQDRLEYLFG